MADFIWHQELTVLSCLFFGVAKVENAMGEARVELITHGVSLKQVISFSDVDWEERKVCIL